MKSKNTLFLSLFVIILFSNNAFSQTSYFVNVTNFAFNPSTLNINVGDTVIWTNTQGTHNVNGTTATFPSNPQSFGNSVGSGWVFTYVFAMAGTYDYHCDPHSSAMIGSIIVSPSTEIEQFDLSTRTGIKLVYPNPATDRINIEIYPETLSSGQELNIRFYDMMGREITRKENITETTLSFNIQEWPKSLYFYKLESNQKIIQGGSFIK